MLAAVEGKGRGLVAARDIAAGELITRDRAVLTLSRGSPARTRLRMSGCSRGKSTDSLTWTGTAYNEYVSDLISVHR